MPSQCSMASSVVAFRVAPLSPCSTGRARMECTPSARAVRLAGWAARTSGPGAAPAGTSRPSIIPRQTVWQRALSVGATAVVAGLRSTPTAHLAMCAQHAMKTGLTGDVEPFVGQRRDDPRRRRLDEARFVGDRDDPALFGLAQCCRTEVSLKVGAKNYLE
jgi:hypothetical protein